MNQSPRPPILEILPESAPFSPELNGFFAGLLQLDAPATPLSPQEAAALMPGLLAPAGPPAAPGVGAGALTRQIDQFLGSRGYGADGAPEGRRSPVPASRESDPTPLDFVCEEDVRLAIQAGRKLVVSERAIVTPSARDLGEEHRVFSVAPWRG